MPELTFEKWWAYVVKYEIEPTLRSACLPPVIIEPISTVWFRKLKPVGLEPGDAS